MIVHAVALLDLGVDSRGTSQDSRLRTRDNYLFGLSLASPEPET